MNHLVRPMSWLLFIGMAVVGCSRSDEPIAEMASTVAPVVGEVAASVRPAVNATVAPDLAEPEEGISPVAEFAAPFPDRSELFEPPQRVQSSVRRDDEYGEMVELKGFINVDEPRVILSIDGVISPVPEGGEKYGVQVISIEPPKVVLQRGRKRWTATLE